MLPDNALRLDQDNDVVFVKILDRQECTKILLLNVQYSLENICMASRCSPKILWLILSNEYFKDLGV